MATAAIDPTTATAATASADSDAPPLYLDSIPTVDLRLLSQSELYSLSLCSDSAFDPRRCDDVVIPKIDRSVFNESAGSRKQTYSRLRLAPPSSSFSNSSSPLLRRTPHLRPSHPLLNAQTNPEHYENSQIILLLNQLFNGDDASTNNNNYRETENDNFLVPIRVDYSESLPQSTYMDPVTRKKKRGRPRKNHNLVIPVEPMLGWADADVVMNVYGNAEEREKEIFNINGVAVDLVALAGLQDPYEVELRRKTHAFTREEDVLAFMSGLFGQWGNKSMRKKIVDASDYGDTLPRGWKLLLSVKKKEGRFGLSCHRYLSPNGRQFVSCKEVSSYLLSIVGTQGANQIDNVHGNNKIQTEENMTSGNVVQKAPDNTFHDYYKMEKLTCQLSLPLNSASGSSHESQKKLKNDDFLEGLVGEPFQSEKCSMTFDDKDKLLQHQLSIHRRKRSKPGTSITDGVIIKGGKYECQFCHKMFDERHHYNGHIGTHVKMHEKNADEAYLMSCDNGVDAPSRARIIASTIVNNNDVKETFDVTNSNVDAYSGSSAKEVNFLAQNKKESLVDRIRELTAEEARSMKYRVSVTKNEMGIAFESVDVMKPDSVLVAEATLSGNTISKHDSFGETVAIECREIVEKSSFESCLPSPVINDQIFVAQNNAVKVPAVKKAVSKTCAVSDSSKKDDSGIENVSTERFIPTSNFCKDQSAHNCDSVAKLKHYSSEGCSFDTSLGEQQIRTTHGEDAKGALTSIMAESEQNNGSEGCIIAPTGDGTCGEYKVSSISFVEPELDGTYNLDSIDFENFDGSNKCMNTIQEEPHFERSLNISSKIEQEHVNEHYTNEDSACAVVVSRQKQCGENSSLCLSDYQQNYDVEDYVNIGPSGKIQELKAAEVQDFFGNEFASGGSYTGHSANVVGSPKHDLCLEVCSSGVSGNEQAFGVRDYATEVYHNTAEERKQERSEIDLFAQFCFQESPSDVFISNKMYTTSTVNEPKRVDFQKFRNHELSLAFGNFHEGLSTDMNSDRRESYTTHFPSMPSVIESPFGIQTNPGSANSCMTGDLRQKSYLPISSCSGDIHGYENNVSPARDGRFWNRPQVDEARNSGNQFMVAFSGAQMRPSEDSMAAGIWKSSENHFLQNGLVSSSSLVPPSSSFHTFDIISDKGEDGRLKGNSEFNSDSCFEGLRTVRTEPPMEFSFLTTQHSNSLSGDSKVFSYQAEMQHEYDSSYWLGKDASMSNTARTSSTIECAWCKNEFHHEPIHSGTQTGTIGSLCPTCCGRFSGQLNVL